MTDVFSTEKRSWIMRHIPGKGTSPEIKVRSLTHRLGYRFRLHRKDLPGKPDLAFPSRKKVIFIHGCFWHGHNCPRGNRTPQTNAGYWISKIERNRERDDKNITSLKAIGWKVLVIWECEIKEQKCLSKRLQIFLTETAPSKII